jgi:site-specific recombinase XerD
MIPSNSEDSGSTAVLSLQQVRNLINSINDMRDRLIVRVLYETGSTLAELVNIKISDLCGDRIRIVDEDSKQLRFVKISAKLAKDIRLYSEGNILKGDSFLLASRQGPGITERRIRQIIQEYTEKLGYGKINPHMFRYYHIMHAYQNGVYIDNISNQLGITRYRIFQVIESLDIQSGQNMYNRFLSRI